MLCYPDVQRRAQEELDLVVGNDRLPGPEDREHLPYINAIVKETMRWQPVTPLGGFLLSPEELVIGAYVYVHPQRYPTLQVVKS